MGRAFSEVGNNTARDYDECLACQEPNNVQARRTNVASLSRTYASTNLRPVIFLLLISLERVLPSWHDGGRRFPCFMIVTSLDIYTIVGSLLSTLVWSTYSGSWRNGSLIAIGVVLDSGPETRNFLRQDMRARADNYSCTILSR